MSFSRRIQRYHHSYADPIWPDVTSNISAVTEHTPNQILLASYQKKFFFQNVNLVLLDEFLDSFSKFQIIIVEIAF
jgi:hypothetical protein